MYNSLNYIFLHDDGHSNPNTELIQSRYFRFTYNAFVLNMNNVRLTNDHFIHIYFSHMSHLRAKCTSRNLSHLFYTHVSLGCFLWTIHKQQTKLQSVKFYEWNHNKEFYCFNWKPSQCAKLTSISGKTHFLFTIVWRRVLWRLIAATSSHVSRSFVCNVTRPWTRLIYTHEIPFSNQHAQRQKTTNSTQSARHCQRAPFTINITVVLATAQYTRPSAQAHARAITRTSHTTCTHTHTLCNGVSYVAFTAMPDQKPICPRRAVRSSAWHR